MSLLAVLNLLGFALELGEVIGAGLLLNSFLGFRLREDSILAIDMLVKVWFYWRMHRVQNEVDSFSARELCGGNKAAVSGNQDNGRRLMFIRLQMRCRCRCACRHLS